MDDDSRDLADALGVSTVLREMGERGEGGGLRRPGTPVFELDSGGESADEEAEKVWAAKQTAALKDGGGSEFPLKQLPDGAPNPRYVDLQKSEAVHPKQRFGVYSFISPEHIIPSFEIFCQDKFFQSRVMKRELSPENEFVAWVSQAYGIDPNEIYGDFLKYQKSRTENPDLFGSYHDAYNQFIDSHGQHLEAEFKEANKLRTCVRSFKFYGAFPTQEAADRFRNNLKPEVGVAALTAQHGTWLHWDPSGVEMEYADEKVNDLFHKKRQNEEKAAAFFKERVEAAKRG